jgi:hypothetical protein
MTALLLVKQEDADKAAKAEKNNTNRWLEIRHKGFWNWEFVGREGKKGNHW